MARAVDEVVVVSNFGNMTGAFLVSKAIHVWDVATRKEVGAVDNPGSCPLIFLPPNNCL